MNCVSFDDATFRQSNIHPHFTLCLVICARGKDKPLTLNFSLSSSARVLLFGSTINTFSHVVRTSSDRVCPGPNTHIQTPIHSYRQVSKSFYLHVFALWEETSAQVCIKKHYKQFQHRPEPLKAGLQSITSIRAIMLISLSFM